MVRDFPRLNITEFSYKLSDPKRLIMFCPKFITYKYYQKFCEVKFFLIFVKINPMSPNLKHLIENNEVSEMEIVEFLETIKKLSTNNVLDPKNFKLVLDHFGLKEKKGWIKFDKSTKYKF
jgi:hypothetical protein